ncbi:MAG: hypothetical protein DMF52_03280 [Acidobacteria bacterium]|nr:MAG: hypothetical protein DMF52_03280 [Acidobacteriota bacterium]
MFSGKDPTIGLHGNELTFQKIPAHRDGERAHLFEESLCESEKIGHRTGSSSPSLSPPILWSEVGVQVIWIVALDGEDQTDIGIRHVVERVALRPLASAA